MNLQALKVGPIVKAVLVLLLYVLVQLDSAQAQSEPSFGFITDLQGKEIVAGEKLNLEWETNIPDGLFTLQYKRNETWITIQNDIAATQKSYTWQTPSATDYIGKSQVRLMHADYPEMVAKTGSFDLIKGMMGISRICEEGETENCSDPIDVDPPDINLDFTTDLLGKEILAGDELFLEWEDDISEGSFTLQYKHGDNWVTIISGLSADKNNYNWKTPSAANIPGDKLETQLRIVTSSNAYFTSDTFSLVKKIKVLQPNADDIIKKGKTQQIIWETNVEDDVKIQLLDANDVILDTLAYSTSPRTSGSGSKGSYLWSVSGGYNSIEAGKYYRIRVSTPHIEFDDPPLPYNSEEIGTLNIPECPEDPDSYEDPECVDDPDYPEYPNIPDQVVGASALFYVDYADYVDVSYPNPYNALRPGEDFTIRWATNIPTLDIELVGDDGVITIKEDYNNVTSDPNNEQHNELEWTIPPDFKDGTYNVRFKGNGSIITSDNFLIEAKSITISKPNDSEIWDPGTAHQIRWEDNFDENVGIDLYQNGSPAQTIEASTDSDGSYEWDVFTADITEGDNYKIVIYAKDDPDVEASSGSFSILNFKAGDYTLNYVKSQTAKVPVSSQNQLRNLPDTDVNTSVTYADGMGKTRQTISVGISPNGNDVVKFKRYNTIGQEDTTWQPFTAPSRDGRFQLGAVDRQENFYKQGQDGVPQNDAPYATAEYEKSPMLRVKEQGSVGEEWQPNPGSDNDHTVKMDYGTNKPGEVLFWKVDTNGNPETDGYYARGQLQVTRVVDENGAVSFTYEDQEGNEILKLGYKDDDTPVKTYYVYDRYNNLRYIVPPEASKRLEGETNKTLDKNNKVRKTWLTEFRYDAYDRVVWKKIPEADPVYTIYDPMGRVILTQDGNQRAKDQWFFTKYDIHGRTIMTGLYTESNSDLQTREDMQKHVYDIESYTYYERRSASNFDKQHGYTFDAFPNALNQCDIWTVSWYDDYDFNRDGQPDYNFKSRDEFTEVVNNDGNVVEHVPSERTFDKATGGLTRVLKREIAYVGDGEKEFNSVSSTTREVYIKYNRIVLKPGFRSVPNQKLVIGPEIEVSEDLASDTTENQTERFLSSATFYDKYGNTIYTFSENNLNGTDKTWNLYDFSGKVLRTVREHESSVLSSPITVRKRFEYDHGDRLTRVWQQNNDDPKVLIAQNEYNELGKLIRKSLHSDNDGGIFLQNVDYNWHQRGWLKSVNNPQDLTKAGEYKDLFAFDLFYEDLPQDLNVKEQFNGNVTGTRWKTADDANISGYSYRYDDLNQIREALYGTSSNGTDWSNTSNRFNTSYDYDLNGNMQWAKRRGNSSLIDDLSYYYKGNLLAGVDDIVSDTTGMHFADFGSKFTPEAPEYYYDLNGNMIVDLNKGFEVLYNEMNLPERVDFGNGSRIEWRYTAGGTKLKKMVYDTTGKVFEKHYRNGYVYRDTTLKFFTFDEGRVRNYKGNLRYEYDLTDHLGNVRATFTSENGLPKLLQRDDYYPFGLKFNSTVNGPENKFTYNGKELEDEHGLNWYYYGWRFYDPAVARWWAIDPADEFHTPFGYVGNNPINFTDFMGMMSNCPDCYDGGTLGEITVTAPRIYDSNFQNIGGEWGAWLFAFTHDFMSAFTDYNMYNYYNINGTYYAENKIWAEYGTPITGTAPVPGRIGSGKLASGIGSVNKSLKGGLNIYRYGSSQATKASGWKLGDRFLYLSNKGTPKLNWKQNYGALRREMKLGKPIYDSYRLESGQLIKARVWDPVKDKYVGQFLNAERYILRSRGWTYNPSRGAWMPPN